MNAYHGTSVEVLEGGENAAMSQEQLCMLLQAAAPSSPAECAMGKAYLPEVIYMGDWVNTWQKCQSVLQALYDVKKCDLLFCRKIQMP